MYRSAIVPAVLLVALAGCSSTPDPATPASSAPAAASTTASNAVPASSPPASPAASGSQTSDDPQVVADSLKVQISEISAVVQVTEANDSNDLIGRPGKYDAATFMKDSRLTCSASELKDLDTSCGAKLERWPSQAAAQARADFIQKALEAMPILGTEYDYVRGGLLLRVAGDLKPSQAKEYQQAFLG